MKLFVITALCLVGALDAKGLFSRRVSNEEAVKEAVDSVKGRFGVDKEYAIRECMGKENDCESVACFYMTVTSLTDDQKYIEEVVQWALGLRGMCWTDICDTCGWCEEKKREFSNKKRYNKDQALNEATGSIKENFDLDREADVKACLEKSRCESVACFYNLATQLTQNEDYLMEVGRWALRVNEMCFEDICSECGWCGDYTRSFPASKKSTSAKLVSLSTSAKKRFLSKLNK